MTIELTMARGWRMYPKGNVDIRSWNDDAFGFIIGTGL